MYIPRLLTPFFKRITEQFPAVLITGPRQSGKSTLLLEEMKNCPYVAFDDPLNREFALKDPNAFLDQFDQATVILDEIQYVPELLQYIKIRIDRHKKAGNWIMTGSQQFHLMRNVSESLAGRIAVLELAPFCFPEIIHRLSPSLEEIIWTGLFPDPACTPGKREIWLRSYIQTYIERDVRQLEAVKNFRAFELFVNLSAAFHSQEFHPARLARECGVSQPTIKSWCHLLETSYIAVTLPPFYKNFGKRLIKTPKFYFLDPALVCYLTRQPSREAALSGSMGGSLFEGLMVAEAVKYFFNSGKKPPVYFWRSAGGLEVDLIIESTGKLWPVEIKLTATPTAKHADPLNQFKKLAGSQAADKGCIVCRTKESRQLPGNNVALPWQEFHQYLASITA